MATSVFSGHDAGREPALQATMNITPLVDVMLVLLVIFMVTAPALAMRAEINLPQAGPVAPDPPPTLVLEVGSSGQWWLDGLAMTRAETETHLRTESSESPRTVLMVRAQGDADYQAFVSALAMADASGMSNVVTGAR